MLLTPPNRKPSCQMRASRQSGHHRRRLASAVWAAVGRGPNSATRSAVSRTGRPQNAIVPRQLPPASGSTTGSVRLTATISPISSPLV